MFGIAKAPLLEYRYEELDKLAEQVIRSQTSLTGVHPKLSLSTMDPTGLPSSACGETISLSPKPPTIYSFLKTKI